MLDKIFKSERLIFKPFSMATEEEKQEIIKSWSNPFNARYNATKDAKKSVENLCNEKEPTFQNLENYMDCMYFRVAFDKQTQEVVGTCRFGKYHNSRTNDCWDFGFNILLKHWYKGYGVEIVATIIDLAQKVGVKTIIGGADIENYGSYKAMIKNGFEFQGYDDDGDYRYTLDLIMPAKTKSEIDFAWSCHLDRTKKDFGLEKFNRLNFINQKIIEMVEKIQSGENEDELVEKYFKELNQIEEFKFS